MEISRIKLLKILSIIVILPIIGVVLYTLFNMDTPKENKTDTKTEKKIVESILPSTFKEEFNANDGRVILDIRTPEEFAAGRLNGAVNIDFYDQDFRANLEKLDRETEYLLYCNSGNRSASALTIMQQLGFTNVKELSGGIQSWMGAGNEVCTDC